ncbi:MAG: hypothetical protein ACK4HR_09040 [Hyphomonas sp.]|jgi:hypothetical protein
MAKKKDVLPRIVALKRQRVEQQVLALQQEVARLESSLRDLAGRLKATDNPPAGIEALSLSQANGHVPKLVRDIDARKAELARRRSELDAARLALRNVFHSEEQLAAARRH